MTGVERALTRLVQAQGIIVLLALPAALMPTAWMDATHAALGLGELPRGPIVEYLTRSLSALYAGWGVILLFLARDVRRYAPLLVLLAILGIVFGLGMLALDLWAGMPTPWTAFECPFILLVSAAQYLLARRVMAEG